MKSWWVKALHITLDSLMIVVPLLELTEFIAIIPMEYLPFYMLGTVLLRRFVRYLEEYLDAKPIKTNTE